MGSSKSELSSGSGLMIATNDITGDQIVTKPASDLYRNNWDRIFGWISISDNIPPPSKIVEVKTKEGNIYEVYLCSCCKSEWRDSISGSMIMIDVTHWRNL